MGFVLESKPVFQRAVPRGTKLVDEHQILRVIAQAITAGVRNIHNSARSSTRGVRSRELYRDASNVFHGFLCAFDGRVTDGSVRSSLGTKGLGINPAGTITGFYSDSSDVYHRFLRGSNGTVTTFDAPRAGAGEYQGTVAGDRASSLRDVVWHNGRWKSKRKIHHFHFPGAGHRVRPGPLGSCPHENGTLRKRRAPRTGRISIR